MIKIDQFTSTLDGIKQIRAAIHSRGGGFERELLGQLIAQAEGVNRIQQADTVSGQPLGVRIRTNNPMGRIIREVRRRTRVVGAFGGL